MNRSGLARGAEGGVEAGMAGQELADAGDLEHVAYLAVGHDECQLHLGSTEVGPAGWWFGSGSPEGG